jgi:hypothetical protein
MKLKIAFSTSTTDPHMTQATTDCILDDHGEGWPGATGSRSRRRQGAGPGAVYVESIHAESQTDSNQRG